MKKQIVLCVCMAVVAAAFLTACARTPERKLKIRTDIAPIQALLPDIDIQACAWADIRSGSILGALIPDMYIFGVIALSDRQVQDIMTAFEWTEPENLNIEADQLYLAKEYFGVAEPSQMHLVVSSSFNERNTPEHQYNGFYLAEQEQLLLFVYATL